jgi:DNA-directed RNA polymerase subunit RPC12/RpoP
MVRIPARVVPKPAKGTRQVIDGSFRVPLVKDGGKDAYTCGACGAILVKGIKRGEIANVVIQCRHCGKYNEISEGDLTARDGAGPAPTKV